jgi:hypothetical protein
MKVRVEIEKENTKACREYWELFWLVLNQGTGKKDCTLDPRNILYHIFIFESDNLYELIDSVLSTKKESICLEC